MANLPAHQGTRGRMTRQRPQHPFDLFRTQMDDLFDQFFGGSLDLFHDGRNQMRVWDFNVTENDKEILVRAEIPGFDEKDLDVQLQDDVLTIKAEKEQKGDGQEEYRSFFRTVTLPQGIDAERVQATYRNGVLELHLPRPEGSHAKRIQLQGQQPAQAQAQTQSKPAAQTSSHATQSTQAAEQTAAKPRK